MSIFMDKVAIVTGGASGIGRGIAEALAARGATVIVADMNAGLAEQTASAISKSGGKAKPVKLDVTDFKAVEKLVNDVVAEYGKLDFMFNNAGIAIFAEARDYSFDDWRKVTETDFYGPLNGCIAAYPVMVKQGFGRIINTASLAGLVPSTHLVSYTASKHGVVGLSLALRLEGAGLGVKVNVVCPGLIQTPMYNSPTIKIEREAMLKMAPKGMPPEKCARAILKGVERDKPIIVITALAKIVYILYRISPTMMLRFGERFIKRARKQLRVED